MLFNMQVLQKMFFSKNAHPEECSKNDLFWSKKIIKFGHHINKRP